MCCSASGVSTTAVRVTLRRKASARVNQDEPHPVMWALKVQKVRFKSLVCSVAYRCGNGSCVTRLSGGEQSRLPEDLREAQIGASQVLAGPSAVSKLLTRVFSLFLEACCRNLGFQGLMSLSVARIFRAGRGIVGCMGRFSGSGLSVAFSTRGKG